MKNSTTTQFFPKNELKMFKKFDNWRNIEDEIEKRILSQNFSEKKEMCFFITYTNNDEKIALTLFCLYPLVTYKSSFLKSDRLAYLSYNLNTKKFFKFGNINLLLNQILNTPRLKKLLNLDWVKLSKGNSTIGLEKKYNQNILKKILFSDLSNEILYFKLYFSISLKMKNVPAKAIFKINKDKKFDLDRFKRMLAVSECPENAIKYYYHFTSYKHNSDLLTQAFVLKEKIKFNWSINKLNEIHKAWSKKVANIKAKYMEKETITYNSSCEFSYGNILKSNIEVFVEGEEMNHCVFANGYWEGVKDKYYLLISYKNKEKRGTALIKNHKDGIYIKQFYGYANSDMPREDFLLLEKCINDETILKSFILNEIKITDNYY